MSSKVDTRKAVAALQDMLKWVQGIRDAEHIMKVVVDAENISGQLIAGNNTLKKQLEDKKKKLKEYEEYVLEARDKAEVEMCEWGEKPVS